MGKHRKRSVFLCVQQLLINMSTPLKQSVIMGSDVEDEEVQLQALVPLFGTCLMRKQFVGPYLMAPGFLAGHFFLSGILYAAAIVLFLIFFRKRFSQSNAMHSFLL
jgi:hypothetical protein